MTKNLPTPSEIAEAAPGVLRALDLEALDAVMARSDAEKALHEAVKKAVVAELGRRYGVQINTAYLREHKDTGSIHIEDSGYDLHVDRPKRVEWDQAILQKVGDEISASGDDVFEYLKVTYSVDERKYTAWPEFIRAKFEAARTVKPGAMTIRLAKLSLAEGV